MGGLLALEGRAAAVEQAAEQVARVLAVVSTDAVLPLPASRGAVAETGDEGNWAESSVWL